MIEMIQGDCKIEMAKMKDGEYDLAIVDPPYGIGIANCKGFYHTKGVGQANPHTPKKWDSAIPEREYFDDLFRVSKNQIVWGW